MEETTKSNCKGYGKIVTVLQISCYKSETVEIHEKGIPDNHLCLKID